MSDFNSNDPGVSDAARNNPITRATEVIADWIEDNPRDRKVIVGLGTALAIALVAILVLANRPAEQVVTEVAVPVKASLVAVTVVKGDDLGSIGARYGRDRVEMVGFNLGLLERNTLRCDDKKAGVCRRDRFGERELAFDAVWPGDIVLVVPHDALETPSFASTTP